MAKVYNAVDHGERLGNNTGRINDIHGASIGSHHAEVKGGNKVIHHIDNSADEAKFKEHVLAMDKAGARKARGAKNLPF
jgi:hypothetical protein